MAAKPYAIPLPPSYFPAPLHLVYILSSLASLLALPPPSLVSRLSPTFLLFLFFLPYASPMASYPLAFGTSQKLWDDALTRILDLSTATVKHNAELEARISELENELRIWKQAHAKVLALAENESHAHKARLVSLSHKVATMNSQIPLILCVINGNEHLFNPSLLKQGVTGGRIAAELITQSIANFLSNVNLPVSESISFWITVYVDKMSALEKLILAGACTSAQFQDFLTGFSQVSPRLLVVDVGSTTEGVDRKIQEYLRTYAKFPQTCRIFVAGSNDYNYMPILRELDADQSLEKIVWLESRRFVMMDRPRFGLPTLTVDGLFAYGSSLVGSDAPKTPSPTLLSPFMNGGLPSPESPTINVAAASSATATMISPVSAVPAGKKEIDPTLPLHKQNPPPCNEHYLMSCTKGPSCKYSHDYELTPEQLEILCVNAKKAPCNFLKNGQECPYGDRCCWGHRCPNGPQCFHLSKGKCWFKGDGMHPKTDSTATTPIAEFTPLSTQSPTLSLSP